MSTPTPSAASNPSYVAPVIAALLILSIAVVAQGVETEEIDSSKIYDLAPAAEPIAINKVMVELQVGGDLLVDAPQADRRTPAPATPPAKDLSDDQAENAKKSLRLPLSVEAKLEYDEQTISAKQSVRYYRTAEATLKVDAGAKAPRLARAHRLIVADKQQARRVTLTSPTAKLSRDELDLIDIVGDARALDNLLPAVDDPTQVAEGDGWDVGKQAMAGLLGLDSVAVCEVRCVLEDGNQRYAKFQLVGTVHGAVDSAASEFEVRAIGLFHREHRQVTQLNLAMTETREVGAARPGFEGTAKIKIKRMPTLRPEELDEPACKAALAALEKSNATPLALQASRQGFRVEHDRQWYIAGEGREAIMLRRVDELGLIAQTTFKRLPPKSVERRPTTEQFEKEIRFAHGESFGSLVSSEQWTNQSGCHCLGIVARGKAEDVPVEWRYYLVMPGDASTGKGGSSEQRHMISITTTVEQSLAERARKSDRDLADRLELIKPVKTAPAIAKTAPKQEFKEKSVLVRRSRPARTASKLQKRSRRTRRR